MYQDIFLLDLVKLLSKLHIIFLLSDNRILISKISGKNKNYQNRAFPVFFFTVEVLKIGVPSNYIFFKNVFFSSRLTLKNNISETIP